MTEEEYDRFLDAAKDPKDRLIFYVLGDSGMRVKEFRHVRPWWLIDGKVMIPAYDPRTGFTAKTRGAARAVPLKAMSRGAWDRLKEWIDEYGEIGMAYITIYKRVRAGGKRTGLPFRMRPHGLRALTATRWAYRLRNSFQLKLLMGWESIGVAERYVAAVGGNVEQAIKRWKIAQT